MKQERKEHQEHAGFHTACVFAEAVMGNATQTASENPHYEHHKCYCPPEVESCCGREIRVYPLKT